MTYPEVLPTPSLPDMSWTHDINIIDFWILCIGDTHRKHSVIIIMPCYHVKDFLIQTQKY